MTDVFVGECSFCGTDNIEVVNYKMNTPGYGGSRDLCHVCAFSPASRMAEYPGNFNHDTREIVEMIAWSTNHILARLKGNSTSVSVVGQTDEELHKLFFPMVIDASVPEGMVLMVNHEGKVIKIIKP